MTREDLEFRISQYADGTLPEQDVAALDEVFATDAQARASLGEYRALDAVLKREMKLPEVKWEELAAAISVAVAKEELPARTIRLWTVKTFARVAIAAMVMVAVGVGLMQLRPTRETVANKPMQNAATGVVAVAGPSVEAAKGAPVAVVSIGPSLLAQRQNNRVGETIVYRAPRVVIASRQGNRQDGSRLPY
jgi:negative regulator of sigma E activity